MFIVITIDKGTDCDCVRLLLFWCSRSVLIGLCVYCCLYEQRDYDCVRLLLFWCSRSVLTGLCVYCCHYGQRD